VSKKKSNSQGFLNTLRFALSSLYSGFASFRFSEISKISGSAIYLDTPLRSLRREGENNVEILFKRTIAQYGHFTT